MSSLRLERSISYKIMICNQFNALKFRLRHCVSFIEAINATQNFFPTSYTIIKRAQWHLLLHNFFIEIKSLTLTTSNQWERLGLVI